MKIFSKQYWLDSLSNFKKVKSIALMSILMAACVTVGGLCSIFPIKLFDRTMSLIFIFWPIFAILFGPVPTTIIAGIVDLLMFVLFPTGYPMYIGYTFTQMLIGLVNGLLFYKTKISILKIFISQFIINFGIHVGIESLFMADIMKYGFEAYKTYVIGGIIKNGLFLPIEIISIFIILGALFPVLRIMKITDESYLDKIYLFK